MRANAYLLAIFFRAYLADALVAFFPFVDDRLIENVGRHPTARKLSAFGTKIHTVTLRTLKNKASLDTALPVSIIAASVAGRFAQLFKPVGKFLHLFGIRLVFGRQIFLVEIVISLKIMAQLF